MNKDNIPGNLNYILIYGLILAAAVLFPGGMLFSQSVSTGNGDDSGNPDSGILKFTEVLKDAGSSTGFMEAQAAYEKSLLELDLYGHPGDAVLSLTPGVKSQWTDSDFPGQTDLNLTAGVSFFLGRSSVQEEKYQSAELANATARLAMDGALNDSRITLYGLYSDLRLLQEENNILKKENQLASERYEGTFHLYTGGAASLDDLETASDELESSEDLLNQNLLKQRLTWFALQQARGMGQTFLSSEIPVLEEYVFNMPEFPKPSLLADRAASASEEILKTENSILSLNQTVERLNGRDLNMVIKPSVSYGDYSFGLNYALISRNMTLNLDGPLASFNIPDSQVTQEKWTGGLSVALNFDSGTADTLDKQVLQSEIRRQEILLQEQEEKSALALRSAYQRLIQARESLKLAESSMERLNRLKEAVYLRYETGSALKSDLLAADLAVLRGQWKISAVLVEVRQAYLALAALTGEVPF